MADNIAVTPGTGATVATDDIGGIQFQRVKVTWGVDGVANDASATNPLPITGALTDTQLRAAAVPVSGTFWQATQPVSGTVSVSGSVAVTGTFWQATQPVSIATLPALAAGTNNIGDVDVLTINGVAPAFGSGVRGATVQRVTIATDDVVPASQSGTWNITNVSGTVSLPTGAATSANQSTEITALGGVTETAPATDTASSGLNGRLQRLAQRITSLIGQIPAALGQTTMANSLSVTVASNQSAVPVSAASLPLPTGAATETSLAKLTIAQAATTSGQTGPLIQGSVTTAAPTYTTGQVGPLSLDTSGQLRITGTVTAGGLNQGSTTSGQQGSLTMGAVTTAAPSYTTAQTSPLSLTTAGLLRVDGSGVTQPVSGTITVNALPAGSALIGKVGIDQTTVGTTNAVSLAQIGANTVATGNGVVSTGVQRVAIASDNTAFSVNAVQSGTWNVGTVTTVSTVTNLSQFGGAAINLGAGAVGTGTLRITQASDSPEIASLGAPADAAWASGSGSQIALLKTLATAALDTTTVSPVKIDQTTDGTTNAVAVKNSPAGNTAKTYTGTFSVAASALTRPANVTAYTALDSISNNATAGSVTANSVTLSDTNDHPIDLAEILLDTTDTGPGTAAIQIRVHLFNADPTASTGVVGGDNAAYSNKRNGWVGSFSGTMRAFSDGSKGVLVADEGTLRFINPTSGAKTLYWQLQTLGGFTPSANSTTFTPTFKGFQARPA